MGDHRRKSFFSSIVTWDWWERTLKRSKSQPLAEKIGDSSNNNSTAVTTTQNNNMGQLRNNNKVRRQKSRDPTTNAKSNIYFSHHKPKTDTIYTTTKTEGGLCGPSGAKNIDRLEIPAPCSSSWSTASPSSFTASPSSVAAAGVGAGATAERRASGIFLREILVVKDLDVENLAIEEFQKIILEPEDQLSLPNLKILTWHARSTAPPPPPPSSPSLDIEAHLQKEMDEMKWRRTIFRILQAAPNLEQIKNFQFDTDYDLVIASHKVHAVQQLCLMDTVNVDNLIEFVDAGPRVKVLQLIDTGGHSLDFESRDRLATAIKFLFLAIADTLRVLDLSQFCSYIDVQICQKLLKLHQLTIGSVLDPYRPSRVFPRDVRLEEIFPHLRVLDCSRLQCDENCYWDFYFPPATIFHGHLSTVKVLVVSDECTHFFMEKLKTQLCPNFTKLVVDSRGHGGSLDFMLVKIFLFWRHLQSLQLRIKDFPTESSAFCLDSALTGMREETCQRLRVFGPKAGHAHDETIIKMASSGQDVDKYITSLRPSITNLKDLKAMDITLGHRCLEKLAQLPDEDSMPLMSFVSGRYGFCLLPELKVSITFDHRCTWGDAMTKKLEQLSAYVTLRHKRDNCCY